jgi:glutaredoxin
MAEPTSLKFKIKEVFTYLAILAVGLGIGLGVKEGWAWYNTPPAFIETNTAPHFVNIDKKVVVYSTSWCKFCKKTREFLVANNVPFEERDIEQGDADIDRLYQSIGSGSIPQVVIGNKIIVGFNQKLMQSELKAQKLI